MIHTWRCPTKRTSTVTVMTALVLVLSFLNIALAADYKFKTLPSGYSPRGINNTGTIVGMYWNPVHDAYSGFVVTNGVTETIKLGDPNAPYTVVNGVNDAGTIVGSFGDKDGRHGFILTDGISTTITCGNPSLAYAYGINNAGDVVGEYYTGPNDSVTSGFLWSNGTCTTINYPGSPTTSISGINDAGMIVGNYGDSIFRRAPLSG